MPVLEVAKEKATALAPAPWVRLGAEVEFEVAAPPNSGAMAKWGIVPEYYQWQVEYNDFLEMVEASPASLYKVLTRLAVRILEIAKELAPIVYISENYHYLAETHSLITNGLHFHISFVNDEEHEKALDRFFSRASFFQKLALAQKLYLNADPRVLYSHHLTGALRPSNYNFKKKFRFRPVYFNDKYATFEIRIFSLFDLLFKRRSLSSRLASFIRSLLYKEEEFLLPSAVEEILKTPTDYKEPSDFMSLAQFLDESYEIVDSGNGLYLSYPLVQVRGDRVVKRKAFRALF